MHVHMCTKKIHGGARKSLDTTVSVCVCINQAYVHVHYMYLYTCNVDRLNAGSCKIVQCSASGVVQETVWGIIKTVNGLIQLLLQFSECLERESWLWIQNIPTFWNLHVLYVHYTHVHVHTVEYRQSGPNRVTAPPPWLFASETFGIDGAPPPRVSYPLCLVDSMSPDYAQFWPIRRFSHCSC